LSPFLFIIAMDILSILLDQAVKNSFLEGVKILGSNMETTVSNLLYVNDTLVFCSADMDQLDTLKVILLFFEALSGLRANFQKSFMIPMGNINNISQLAENLGCAVSHLPTTYLGLPLGARHNSLLIWEPIISRCVKKLANWKRSLLSKAGRL